MPEQVALDLESDNHNRSSRIKRRNRRERKFCGDLSDVESRAQPSQYLIFINEKRLKIIKSIYKECAHRGVYPNSVQSYLDSAEGKKVVERKLKRAIRMYCLQRQRAHRTGQGVEDAGQGQDGVVGEGVNVVVRRPVRPDLQLVREQMEQDVHRVIDAEQKSPHRLDLDDIPEEVAEAPDNNEEVVSPPNHCGCVIC